MPPNRPNMRRVSQFFTMGAAGDVLAAESLARLGGGVGALERGRHDVLGSEAPVSSVEKLTESPAFAHRLNEGSPRPPPPPQPPNIPPPPPVPLPPVAVSREKLGYLRGADVGVACRGSLGVYSSNCRRIGLHFQGSHRRTICRDSPSPARCPR